MSEGERSSRRSAAQVVDPELPRSYSTPTPRRCSSVSTAHTPAYPPGPSVDSETGSPRCCAASYSTASSANLREGGVEPLLEIGELLGLCRKFVAGASERVEALDLVHGPAKGGPHHLDPAGLRQRDAALGQAGSQRIGGLNLRRGIADDGRLSALGSVHHSGGAPQVGPKHVLAVHCDGDVQGVDPPKHPESPWHPDGVAQVSETPKHPELRRTPRACRSRSRRSRERVGSAAGRLRAVVAAPDGGRHGAPAGKTAGGEHRSRTDVGESPERRRSGDPGSGTP